MRCCGRLVIGLLEKVWEKRVGQYRWSMRHVGDTVVGGGCNVVDRTEEGLGGKGWTV